MPTSELWQTLIAGYVVTAIIETSVLVVGLSRGRTLRDRLFAGFWLTACSYPFVVFTLPAWIDTARSRPTYLLAAETFAPAFECLLFWLAFRRATAENISMKRDLVAVLVANLTSFLYGELVILGAI